MKKKANMLLRNAWDVEGERVYWDFDLDSKSVRRLSVGDLMATPSRPMGWAAERTIGVLKRQTVFVALFVQGETVVSYVDGVSAEFPGRGARARRATVFPWLRRFTLSRDDDVLFSTYYWFSHQEGWPPNELADIFLMIAATTSSLYDLGAFVHAQQIGAEYYDKTGEKADEERTKFVAAFVARHR